MDGKNIKLVVFSDPHIDIQMKRGFPDFLKRLNNYLHSLNPDIILVTGDVAGSTKHIQQFLEGITVQVKVKIFCPGNHDIWVNGKSFDASWVKYYQIIPELCKLFGWHYLPKNPLIIEKTAFVGTMGWYDYSSRNPKWDDEVSLDQYATKYNESSGGIWMDREFAKFGQYSDKEVADHLAAELIEDLNKISPNLTPGIPELRSKVKLNFEIQEPLKLDPPNNKIDTIVVGTHIVPFLEFVKFTGGLEWDFFSAFIGNENLGKIISSISNKIKKISVFGHTHFRKRKELKHNVEAICCPIGYPNEWKPKYSTLEDLFANRIISVYL